MSGRFILPSGLTTSHLLSPSTPFADVSVAAFDKVIEFVNDARDEDGIIFSEIAEYARSLLPIPKGLETPLPGLPQLLPYKLQRAWQAAELGDVEQAQRWVQLWCAKLMEPDIALRLKPARRSVKLARLFCHEHLPLAWKTSSKDLQDHRRPTLLGSLEEGKRRPNLAWTL